MVFFLANVIWNHHENDGGTGLDFANDLESGAPNVSVGNETQH